MTNSFIAKEVPDKFPMVDRMREIGGNFVSRLADAMVAADPENYRKLCVAFAEITERYQDPNSVKIIVTDTAGLNFKSDGEPAAKDMDSRGRVWWGTPDRSDDETGEPYDADWTLRADPPYGATCWMSAGDLRKAPFMSEEDTWKPKD